MKKIPNHLAIIMDGNGRWAKNNNLKRIDGHKIGVKAVKEIVKHCVKLKIKFLTLYTLSIENWDRPKSEVLSLIKLLILTLDKELSLLIDNKINFNVFGNLKRLDLITRKKINSVTKITKNNSKLYLNLAISYSARDEIVNASNVLIENKISNVKESDFKEYLYTNHIPDPDLLIRTGGEYRLSNFLLWQIAYTELYFTSILWPDFNIEALNKAIKEYQQRERRFGKISEQIQP